MKLKLITLLLVGIGIIGGLTAAIALSDGSSLNDRQETAFKWAEAQLQRDEATQYKLFTKERQAEYDKKDFVVDSKAKPRYPQYKLENYAMQEWKINDSTYIYLVSFRDPVADNIQDEWIEIKKTEDGWRVPNLLFTKEEASPYIAIKEAKIIKEWE
jgi:hypothetical protein